MAIETFGLTISDVLARHLPHVTLDSSSKPTATQGGNILTEIQAEVNGALSAAGFTPSAITSGDAPVSYQIVRRVIALGTAGAILQARSSGISEGVNQYTDEYRRLLKDLATKPEMLSDSFSATSSAMVPRSHITDNNMTDSGTFNDDATPPWRTSDEW